MQEEMIRARARRSSINISWIFVKALSVQWSNTTCLNYRDVRICHEILCVFQYLEYDPAC